MTTETKEKKPRVRRNFDKLREDTLSYCKCMVEVLVTIAPLESGTGFVSDPVIIAKIAAYRDCIARLEGTNGK